MTVSQSDLNLLLPQRTTNESDGGGLMTGNAIVSGDVNALFDDMDETLLARGGVRLKKIFCAVRSANADKLLGGRFYITQDAAEDYIHTLAFCTGSHYDVRSEAQESIERFVVLGTRSALRPVGTQRQGQSSVVFYCDDQRDVPEVGSTLVMIDGSNQQTIKIRDINTGPGRYTYVDNDGEFQVYNAIELNINITQSLEHDFSGADPKPAAQHGTEIFNTQPSTSARYYGIKPLLNDASAGDQTIQANGIMTPLVPASTTENALLDQTPGLLTRVVQPTRSTTITESLGSRSGSENITLPNAWVPGTLRLDCSGSVYVDDGTELQLISGVSRLNEAVVSAAEGNLLLNFSSGGSVSVSYQPGVAIELMPYTDRVEITSSNRQLTYTEALSPLPLPGSVRVQFKFLGRWYQAIDNGTGALVGDGVSGVVNYGTGSASVTLPGEPDAGSSMLWSWSSTPFAAAESIAPETVLVLPVQGHVLGGDGELRWSRGGGNYSATLNDGVLSGSAQGRLVNNELHLTNINNWPTSDFEFDTDRISVGRPTAVVSVAERSGGVLTLDVGATNISPENIAFSLDAFVDIDNRYDGIVNKTRIQKSLRFTGDGNSVLRVGGRAVGSVNPGTGVISLNTDLLEAVVTQYSFDSSSSDLGGGNTERVRKKYTIAAQSVDVIYAAKSVGTSRVTQNISRNDIVVRSYMGDEPLVAGALDMTLDGQRFNDRGDGYLYRSWSVDTAAGIQTGQIDYLNATVEMPLMMLPSSVDALSAVLQSAASGVGAAAAIKKVTFRTAAYPLRPSGLQFMARQAADGKLIRAESASNGDITGAVDNNDQVTSLPQYQGGYSVQLQPLSISGGSASGDVDYQDGIVDIAFSQPVLLSSLTYNAVSYTTVPVDPEILGLNPVRLPANGEVPVFREGGLVLIHNTQQITENTPAAGQVINCGRTNVRAVSVRGANDFDLDPNMYSVDLKTGTVTLADPFAAQNAQGDSLTLPLTISHRQQDLAVAGQVDISGELSLLTPLKNGYSKRDSFVSSVIEFGPMQGRVSNLFDQRVDSSNWSDQLFGDAAVATFNDVDFPIAIDNLGAVEERWKIRFTGTTGFVLIGEERGVVATGSTNADFAPKNPMTDTPYFTIEKESFGAGWVSNNIIRFNTHAAADPVWLIRCNLPTAERPESASRFLTEFSGDAD